MVNHTAQMIDASVKLIQGAINAHETSGKNRGVSFEVEHTQTYIALKVKLPASNANIEPFKCNLECANETMSFMKLTYYVLRAKELINMANTDAPLDSFFNAYVQSMAPKETASVEYCSRGGGGGGGKGKARGKARGTARGPARGTAR